MTAPFDPFGNRPPTGSAPDPAPGFPAPGFGPGYGPPPVSVPLVSRPPSLMVAAVALAVVAVLSLVDIVLVVVAALRLRRTATGLLDVGALGGVDRTAGRGYLSDITTATVVTLLVVAVASTALYLVFAVSVWQGRGWPRVPVTVLTVVSLLGLFGGPVVVVAVVASVVATVMLWLTPTRRYSDYAAAQRRYAQPPVSQPPASGGFPGTMR